MNIQDRLREQRYGKYYIQVPNNDVMNNKNRNHLYALSKHDIYNKVKLIYTTQSKGKYSRYTTKLVSDYFMYLNQSRSRSSSSWTYIVLQQYRRYLYFKANRYLYYNDFSVYATSFYVSILFQMRKYVMYNMTKEGLIPKGIDYNNPASNGYYPLPKPLSVSKTTELGQLLFDIYSDLDK